MVPVLMSKGKESVTDDDNTGANTESHTHTHTHTFSLPYDKARPHRTTGGIGTYV